MVLSGVEKLSSDQQRILRGWLPGAVVVADHSWGLVETTVLELTQGRNRLIVKAGGESDHHIEREIHAHLHWLEPWTARGRAAVLRHFHIEAKLLVAGHLPGRLVLGSEQASDPQAYRQAGQLLAMLHAQVVVADDSYEERENDRSLVWLSRPHRIEPDVQENLRAQIASWSTPATSLVPTHGDWQPRNWLIHEGVVSIIDLGRAALRPAMSDFARLAAQEFRADPALEAAFLSGYGADPREAEAWHRNRVREAIGTAVWAHQVGDEAFEAQGHRMVADVLSEGSRTL